MKGIVTYFLVAVLATSFGRAAIGQPTLYGSTEEDLVQLNVQTGGVVTLMLPAYGYRSVALDREQGRIYAGTGYGDILRADLDTGTVDTVLAGEDFRTFQNGWGGSPCGHNSLYIDARDSKLYAMGGGWCSSHLIRMNLDGTELEWIGGVQSGGYSMDVDPDTRKMFFVSWPFGGIVSRNLDTSDPDTLVEEFAPSVAYDFTAGKIYWMSEASHAILRANLDGSDVDHVMDVCENCSSLDISMGLDQERGHIYYTEPAIEGGYWGSVYRANLDGTEKKLVSTADMRILAIDAGAVNVSTDRNGSSDVPIQFSLGQNYPNPFNPSTTIRFTLPVQVHVRLAVLNAIGQEVAELVDGSLPAATHEVTWNAAGLPTGLYVYTLRTGNATETKTMVLTK